ncbi:MAG: hypothetical protein JO327_03430 [Nitrososphaeraceae archaeon]|nr:hypothetical protein [Nitrososphaeraceae archaeon]
MINQFNSLAGKKIGLCYFSDNWYKGITFPLPQCQQIRAAGAVPFIRMQNWKKDSKNLSDMFITHANITAGKADAALTTYAQAAKNFAIPLLIEYGVEINGNWFPWNQEGPNAFVSAYRHIIDIFRCVGAHNVKFALHLDLSENNIANGGGRKWYPGDQYIDCIGVSAYGEPKNGGLGFGCAGSLKNDGYNRLASISATKPLGIFEWGFGNAKDTADTLAAIPTLYPRIKIIQIWHEHVIGDKSEPYDRRINANPQNLAAYRNGIANPVYTNIYSCPGSPVRMNPLTIPVAKAHLTPVAPKDTKHTPANAAVAAGTTAPQGDTAQQSSSPIIHGAMVDANGHETASTAPINSFKTNMCAK